MVRSWSDHSPIRARSWSDQGPIIVRGPDNDGARIGAATMQPMIDCTLLRIIYFLQVTLLTGYLARYLRLSP